jgi:hypothetical protein
MAQTFSNVRAVLADSSTDIYTVPSSTTAIVIGCQVANRGTAVVDLDVWWTDSSAAGTATYLAEGVGIPVSAAYEPIGGKLVLEAGDKLVGVASTASLLEASVSVLELT